ncbi:MAG TPA: hypothetical protein V6C57_14120 [Coleofasciculaceae cyanobacterium]
MVRLQSDFDYYCKELGRSLSARTWDRVILKLDLENCSLPERRKRLKSLAKIRKANPRLKVSLESIERYQAIERIATLPDGTKGIRIYQEVLNLREVSECQFRRWIEPSGSKYGRNEEYSGAELKLIVQQLILRLASKPELVCFSRKMSSSNNQGVFLWTS